MNAQLTRALWDLSRGTGAVALVMLSLSLCLGVLARSGRTVLGLGRFGVAELHRTAALTGTTLVGVHVVTLLFDPYAQLRLVDIVVPFTGAYRPAWLGLGTLAVDLLFVVVLVSLLRDRLGPRVFHAVHWATYALWPIAVLHGIGAGTDSGTWWFRVLAGACALAFGSSAMWRLSEGYAERGWQRRPRVLPPRGDQAGLR
jgi:sulfoxide reductase heme-binding subunit YedZ